MILQKFLECLCRTAPQYTKAAQTSDVTCVDDDGEEAWGYWPKTDEDDPSNELYPEGIRNFNNMIYVIEMCIRDSCIFSSYSVLLVKKSIHLLICKVLYG